MRIFRPANPSKRRPAWLQSHTKENFIAQATLAVITFVGQELYWSYKDRQELKKLEKLN